MVDGCGTVTLAFELIFIDMITSRTLSLLMNLQCRIRLADTVFVIIASDSIATNKKYCPALALHTNLIQRHAVLHESRDLAYQL